MTAVVTNDDDTPRPGQHVTFLVTGANAGAAGVCAPASCVSDGGGIVTFTYTGAAAGTDTINGSITIASSTQTATAEKIWSGSSGGASSISINDVSVLEGNAGVTPATFTVSLDAPSTKNISVAYTTADGTAKFPSDYKRAKGQVKFRPGETTSR